MGSSFKGILATLPILVGSPLPALAGDCAPVIAASLATAAKPYSTTLTRPGKDGKPTVSHMVQTMTTSYVETHGQWRSMDISSQDRIDNFNEMMQTAKMSCDLVGSDTVNGQAATVYALAVENDGAVSKDKLWISADQLILRAQYQPEDTPGPIDSLYDYTHVEPPAASTPLGKQ